MKSEDKTLLALLLGLPLIVVFGAYIIKPSAMEKCINAGYEWVGGDCTMVDYHE